MTPLATTTTSPLSVAPPLIVVWPVTLDRYPPEPACNRPHRHWHCRCWRSTSPDCRRCCRRPRPAVGAARRAKIVEIVARRAAGVGGNERNRAGLDIVGIGLVLRRHAGDEIGGVAGEIDIVAVGADRRPETRAIRRGPVEPVETSVIVLVWPSNRKMLETPFWSPAPETRLDAILSNTTYCRRRSAPARRYSVECQRAAVGIALHSLAVGRDQEQRLGIIGRIAVAVNLRGAGQCCRCCKSCR